MSKLCDVQAMYGQDFGITVTNAPSNVIESNPEKLPKNMIIISSENDEDDNDKGIPSIFATDYNGNPLRLTYAINTSNGLFPDEDGRLGIHIDKKTIITNDSGELKVDTNKLNLCSFNSLGVSKIASSITSRNNSLYPNDTFISADKNGVLYLSDSFIEHIYKYIASKISTNLYPIIMDNIRGWLTDLSKNSLNYYTTDTIPVASLENDGIIITRHFILNYKSVSGISEEVDFDVNNNEYPIKEIILNSKTTSVVKDSQSTAEISIYKHTLDFTIKFYPNYNLQNNIFLDNQYYIKVHPHTFDENKYLMFYFNQNNVFDQYTNNVDWPIQLQHQTISLNALNLNQPIEFQFNNKYKYFEDSEFVIEIYYIKSNNDNNTEDTVQIVKENINNKMEGPSILINFSNDGQNNSLYQQLKDYLINVKPAGDDIIITQLGDASNKYKYILRYTINGERTYTYEKVFEVNYTLTNLYYAENYMDISAINIFSPHQTNNSNINDYFNIVSEHTNDTNDIQNTIIYKDKNQITIELGSESISKLLSNIITVLNEETNKYTDIVILSIDGTFTKEIFIKESSTQANNEYSIFDLYINLGEDGKPTNLIQNDNILYHLHDTKSEFNFTYDYRLSYPNQNDVLTNDKGLNITTAIKVDELMFQGLNTRTHSSDSNKINYQMTINNYHGPSIYLTVVFDYAKFFTDNIKIFDITYGVYEHPSKEFNQPNGTQLNGSETLTPIETEIYNHSIFFVGISEYLYNSSDSSPIKLIKNTTNGNQGLSTELTIRDENNNISTITLYGTELQEIKSYDGLNYHLFEFEYSPIYWKYIKESNEFIRDTKLVAFSQIINIDYQWNYCNSNNNSNNENKNNLFKYKTSFNIDSQLDTNEEQDTINRLLRLAQIGNEMNYNETT